MNSEGGSLDGADGSAGSAHPSIATEAVAGHLLHLGYEPTELAPAGAGHWSVCFGFVAAGKPLVVRYGHHREDFDLDRGATRFNNDALPVPEVLEIGRAFVDTELGGDEPGCWYAISERVPGEPLEFVTADRWSALVPSVVATMEAMRLAPLPAGAGWGSWTSIDSSGAPIGSHQSWRDALLSMVDEPNDGRIAGWKDNLRALPHRSADFDWGLALLDELLDEGLADAVDCGITHQDMLNRNVHVIDGDITGLFDWGCAAYADHLYEFSLFEFWNPWHPAMDIALLWAELEATWEADSYAPQRLEQRLRVCHLHNGLVHLMYGAYTQNHQNLELVAARMRHLGGDKARG